MQWLLFVLFWIVLALAVALVAFRGGPASARSSLHIRSRGARRLAGTTIAVGMLGIGVAVPAVVGATAGDDHNGPLGTHLTAAQVDGRQLFAANCATCHTLKAANAAGRVGPDLDELRPTKGLVLDAIKNGRARGGIGQMPYGLLTGADAEHVAEFVSQVAGKSNPGQ